MPLRLASLGATALVGIVSKAASDTGTSGASGFAIAAIIAAACTGGATVIGAIATAIVKIRAANASHVRAKTRAQLERERRRLEKQLARLDDEEDP